MFPQNNYSIEILRMGTRSILSAYFAKVTCHFKCCIGEDYHLTQLEYDKNATYNIVFSNFHCFLTHLSKSIYDIHISFTNENSVVWHSCRNRQFSRLVWSAFLAISHLYMLSIYPWIIKKRFLLVSLFRLQSDRSTGDISCGQQGQQINDKTFSNSRFYFNV